ncbi:MAG: Zinc ABC superfamily ATP binding cassette transporter, ABC protein [Bacteroidetes bacterium 38_7]|nr:MAG: Zinc ABC superfamily ATP binding cassette transporter, ABC protein [Bacteroidetes bacterium 38_7]HAL65736.1 zinc ABC transporter ATP-binding protein [Bacteroidales bacterium]
MSNKLIEINDLSAGYYGKPVIHHIQLTVYEGDFIGIIGPNGGGKTTFLKTIAGIIKPLSGSLKFYSPEGGLIENPKLGYLPQVNTFDKSFPISVEEVVLTGLLSAEGRLSRFKAGDKEKVRKVLERLNINHLASKPIGELSGGQMQRVFLARAIVSQPWILLLDEPSTYADNRFEAELYELLVQLNEKMTILMVSHDLGMIPSYIKSIACVNGTLHYHPTPEITPEILRVYNCPIELIAHGIVPHRVLSTHQENSSTDESH